MSVFHTLPDNWVVPKLDGRGNGPYGLYHLFRWRLADKFTADTRAPQVAQKSALDRVLDAARGTEFGAKYGLETVRTYREFSQTVPVHTSKDMEPWLDRVFSGEQGVLSRHSLQSFVKTSGTTGYPKMIPVTHPWSQRCQEAQTLWLMGLLKEFEGIHQGKALTTLGRQVEGTTPQGIPYGSNTGRIRGKQPWYVRQRWAIPPDIAQISDPEVRHYAWLRVALTVRATTWTTANPSMVLAMCRRFREWEDPLRADLQAGTLAQGPGARVPQTMRRRLEKRLRRVDPPTVWEMSSFWKLHVINCWTQGPARYFADRIPAAMGMDIPVRDIGFQASEGVFGIPLHSTWDGAVAWVGGHLMELKHSESGRVIPVYEAERDTPYSLVVSTTSGLCRYDMNDRVEVVGRYQNTPVLRFLGKGTDVSSVVGEKVTGTQVWQALTEILPRTYLDGVGVTVRVGDVPQ